MRICSPFIATVYKSSLGILFWLGSVLSADDYSDESSGCVLPTSYYGIWHFLTDQGILSTMKISKTSIDIRGRCRKAQADRYLFVDIVEHNVECWRYMFFYQKHENVILFKESRCFYDSGDEPDSGDLTDALMFTLIRVGAKSEPCPVKVPFHFNYSSDFDSTRCFSHPSSRVDICSTNHRLAFTYEPCVDPSAFDTVGWKEEIECLASWTDDHMKKRQRFVARILNSGKSGNCCLICVSYYGPSTGARDTKNILDSHKVTNGQYSSVDHLNRGSMCKSFAHWLIHDHVDRNKSKIWQTLGNKADKLLYVFRREECTIYGPNSSSNVFSVSRCVVERLVDEMFAEFIVHETIGCESFYKCIRVYRRTDQIVQLFISVPSNAESYSNLCQNENFIDPHMNTLSLTQPQTTPCPFSRGLYQADVCGRQSAEMNFGCNDPNELSLNYQCKYGVPEKFVCIGMWNDMELSYLIAQRIDDGDSYCIIFPPSQKRNIFLQIGDTCDRPVNTEKNQSTLLSLNASFQTFCDQVVSNPIALSSVARNLDVGFVVFATVLIMRL
uniref:Uncharacterized protein n=1 Tax=Romanomermis culicivorax TaxID=13658 RepID=A0A915K2Y1_ROMCU